MLRRCIRSKSNCWKGDDNVFFEIYDDNLTLLTGGQECKNLLYENEVLYIKLRYTGSSFVSTIPFTITVMGFMPMSGYEELYEEERWNDGEEGLIQSTTNCYAYALNLQRCPTDGVAFPLPNSAEQHCLQPGDLYRYIVDDSWDTGYNLDADTLAIVDNSSVDNNIAIDGFFEEIGQYDVAPSGTYKVALVIDQGLDYHWYRQNLDGMWSHKLGTDPITNLDPLGDPIYDPLYAERYYTYGGNYTLFIGYFAVEAKEGGMYSPSEALAQQSSPSIPLFKRDEQNPAKSLSQIEFIEKGMGIGEIRGQIGLPQQIVGSGIIMDSYLLENGDKLIISYGSMRSVVAKAFIVTPQGERTFIIE